MTSTNGKRGALIAVGVAGAALLIAFDAGHSRVTCGERLELCDLFAALGDEPARPVRGRIAGLAHAPQLAAQRGDGDAAVSPEVTIAVARIKQRVRAGESARNNAALGVAHLAAGKWGPAVELLEDAVYEEPANVLFQNDLAAAYLARASDGGSQADWARGLALASRAIARDPKRPEPYFNRALALRGLHMVEREAAAWTEYERLDPSGAWHAEAVAGRVAVTRRREQATTGREPDNQMRRERVEDDLLARWGTAVEGGETGVAAQLLAEAGEITDQIARSGGDTMAHDEVALIRRLGAAGDHAALRRLAAGHRVFGAARAASLADQQRAASELLDQAASGLRSAGSAYWRWAPVYRAVVLRSERRSQAALDALHAAAADQVPDSYYYLRGRVAWLTALSQGTLGRYDLGNVLAARMVEGFSTAGEGENLVGAQTILAETEWYLGRRASAWSNLLDVLATIDRHGGTRRYAHFDLAATMALGEGLPDAALEFQEALASAAGASVRAQTETMFRRAQTLGGLGRHDAAAREMRSAAALLSKIDDEALRDRAVTEAAIVQAELSSASDCRESLRYSDVAIPRLDRQSNSIRLGALMTVRGRCHAVLGDIDRARADLLDGARLFEARRDELDGPADRAQAFELERAAFREWVALETLTRGDEAAGLQVAERYRAGVLAETWDERRGVPDHQVLPADVAVVYYETLPARVLVWVLTRERREAVNVPMTETSVRYAVARVRRAIERGASVAGLRDSAGPLYRALVEPALTIADGGGPKRRVVFIPDGPLYGLPFGALPDARGEPLLATRVVAFAPSLTTFLAASARLTSFQPSNVLAVGDGHDPATGLPVLPGADAEATQVARLYPANVLLTGPQATRQRFFAARPAVLHFAGHSVVNEAYPHLSRMLLAPAPGTDETGWLLASEITARQFGRVGVVVLASCESAAGPTVEGEGAISLARAFFVAGVPAVVANLWRVDDNLPQFAQTFHTVLRRERDAAAAVRAAQLRILEERPDAPVRVWGGFVMMGGLQARFTDGG